MKKLLLIALCFSFLVGCKKDKTMEENPAGTSPDAKNQPVEFVNAKYTEMVKKSLEDLSKGIWIHRWLIMPIMPNIIGIVAIV